MVAGTGREQAWTTASTSLAERFHASRLGHPSRALTSFDREPLDHRLERGRGARLCAGGTDDGGMLVRESPYRGTFSLDDAIALAKGALDDDRGGYRKEFVAIAEATRRILADRPRGPRPLSIAADYRGLSGFRG
jgi:hypothetical protein